MKNHIKKTLEVQKRIHSKIAEDVFVNGAKLVCPKCDKVIEVTEENCAEFLQCGWPKHCGLTMTIIDSGSKK